MQYATPPDVDRLISGGQSRKRRRTRTRAAGAALVLVLAGGGYAVTQLGDAPEGSAATTIPSATPEPTRSVTRPPYLPTNPGGATIEPGIHRLLVGFDREGAQIDADLGFETRDWQDGNFPTVHVGAFVGGVGVYQTHGLAAGSGCNGGRLNTDLGRVDLIEALAALPRSEVLVPVTRGRAFGRDAAHVRLRIDDDCPGGQAYRVAETPRGSRGISYSAVPTTVTMDFWVVDLGSTDLVVDAWHQSGSSADLVNQVAAVRDSVTFLSDVVP